MRYPDQLIAAHHQLSRLAYIKVLRKQAVNARLTNSKSKFIPNGSYIETMLLWSGRDRGAIGPEIIRSDVTRNLPRAPNLKFH
ncbi:hypothetical protein ABIC60_003608 [Phyllobacterium ifriqiyense]